MWVDPYPLRTLADRNPGYVVPMLSLSADKTILTDDTAAVFVRARDEKGICGFGEFATRLLSNGKHERRRFHFGSTPVEDLRRR